MDSFQMAMKDTVAEHCASDVVEEWDIDALHAAVAGYYPTSFTVERDGDVFQVFGATLERLVAKADLANEEAVAYLQQVMEHAGVSDALRRAGAQPGDTVLIGENEFEFS